MDRNIRWLIPFGIAMLTIRPAWAQTGTPPPAPAKGEKVFIPPPPPANAVAVTVNGQAIPEMAVYRVLIREREEARAQARKEVIEFLIGNVLIDQYLMRMKVNVERQEVEARMAQMRAEAKKEGQDFDKMLKALHLSEDELRYQLAGAMRMEKYVAQQATDKALRDLFESSKAMFDGSRMQARHILLTINPERNAEQARARLLAAKARIEAEVAKELAKLSDRADKLEREKTRMQAMEKAFAEIAAKESDCPSKAEGGSLGWFPRAGAMVEPFARAAFALKPYQLSEPVATEFGQHLILAIDHKPGKDIKFEDVRPVVREVYYDRLRESLISQLRPRARIDIQQAAKQ
ncbi:MAG: hypothetical protein FJ271_14605 [Planctomycetes bacterium]|nr:hypothetical protein [Planctomycetota bacterium]